MEKASGQPSREELEREWAEAKKEGNIIVSVPGEPLHGFSDLSSAILYVSAKNAATGIEYDRMDKQALFLKGEVVKEMLEIWDQQEKDQEAHRRRVENREPGFEIEDGNTGSDPV